MSSPPDRPVEGMKLSPLPTPAWMSIAILVCIILMVGACFYGLSIATLKGSWALTIPDTDIVRAAYLPDEFPQVTHTLEEVIVLDSTGIFVPLPPSKKADQLNQKAHNQRWFRLDFTNPTDRFQHGVFDLIRRVYDDAVLYQRETDGTWTSSKAGPPWPQQGLEYPLRWHAFNVTLMPGETKRAYLLVTDYHRMPSKFLWWPMLDHYLSWERFFYAAFACYSFTWLTVAAHGYFRFALHRQPEQWHFFMFVFLHGLGTMLGRNALSLHLPFSPLPIAEILAGVLICASVPFLFQFIRALLSTKRTDPSIDRLLQLNAKIWMFIPLTPVAGFFPTILPIFMFILGVFGWLGFFLLMTAAARNWRRGGALGLFFVLACVPYGAGLSVYHILEHDSVAWVDQRCLFVLIGNALSLILLSFCLIYRSRLTREEHYLLHINYSTDLEADVLRRTQELQQLSEQLKNAVQDRDRVLAIIGHDLRGPAISLDSLARLIKYDPTFQQNEITDWAAKVSQACRLQLDLLTNLLTWGRSQLERQQTKNKSVNLSSSLLLAWNDLRENADRKRITLNHSIPTDLHAKVPHSLPQVILRNLLGNAIKYSHPGSTIDVTAWRSDDDQTITVTIRDHGVGIPPDRLKALFAGPGTSTEGTSGESGIGVGLTLCHDLIRAADGQLIVESPEEGGTRVTVTFPTGPLPDKS
ncbi:hypothetical protein FEM03_10510 [Phragmitibacter flavus]|uniref:histidine kinase n=1 Tax=Phragmitibacter flavus TaxID=2576071 RepID=A0A5R8KFJ1_9BACT|nr:sensor histidine kinase [Phragmitibacter flavus]TLD70735.1 hypothetical protein FEM03_10510 [Phragmitibacter flavus]